MIKSYTAYTKEIDHVEAAVAEIIAQLNPQENCLTNTVALITCYYEFATNGFIAELNKNLNFPLIGTTTAAVATNHNAGRLDCAVLMITSDDVTFTAACSSSLSHELEDPLSQMYHSALEGHTEAPKLILSAAPIMINYAGDSYVDVLNKISGGVPNFGTLATSDSMDYAEKYVIFNDTVAQDMYSIIIASGNIAPKFIYASLSPEYIFPQTAIITKAEKNLIREVNGLPIIKYMETLGLVSNGKATSAIPAIPLILNYSGENIPVSRVLLSWNEDGSGVCGGFMPEGTNLSIGKWDKADVIGTTTRTLEKIMSGENTGTLLLYSCLSRTFALGMDVLLEANKVKETLSDRLPYLFAYSGGEICPAGKAPTNNFHNNTLIACMF